MLYDARVTGASVRTLQDWAASPQRPRVLPEISRSERRWLATVTLLLVLLAQGPPTVERLWGLTDRVHVGTYWYHTDFSAYLAAMREGASSPSWLIRNP